VWVICESLGLGMPVVPAGKTCKSFREADFVTIWHSEKDAPLGGLKTLQVRRV